MNPDHVGIALAITMIVLALAGLIMGMHDKEND